jgi:hypothetical protein
MVGQQLYLVWFGCYGLWSIDIDGNGNDNEQSNRGWADMGLDLDVDNIMVNPVQSISMTKDTLRNTNTTS